jgi:cyclopropane-fatty-acyl-phospholipid synthase
MEIQFHYDLGNDFYALWLDQRMVYSCAYFAEGAQDLDAAQRNKLDLICRKLDLRPEEDFLDIGCGWGGLVLHAAGAYGARATGITLSEEQAALARQRIAAAGLQGRCRVEVRDYRDMPPGTRFDTIASVGMVEHVGRSYLPPYYAEAYRLLRPGGLFLNHGIISLEPTVSPLRHTVGRWLRRWTSFIERHVFPGSELVSAAELIRPAEIQGFELHDMESLREHYVRTLRQWVARIEARADEAIALVGESTYRTWRLYMAGSAHAFATGRIGVVQLLLGKQSAPQGTRRQSWYSDAGQPGPAG